jgi:iron(III) transport system substrate-binding protein
MLFVDFELTGGQDIFREAFRIGSIPFDGGDPLEGLETYPVPEEKLLEESEEWNTAYEDVVRNGQALE